MDTLFFHFGITPQYSFYQYNNRFFRKPLYKDPSDIARLRKKK